MGNMNSITEKHVKCSGWARISFATSGIGRVAHVSSNPCMSNFRSVTFFVQNKIILATTIRGHSLTSVKICIP